MKSPRLVSARFWRVSVPLLSEWAYSDEFGPHPDKDRLILELRGADGISGWGECASTLTTPEIKEILQRLLHRDPASVKPSFLDELWSPGQHYWQRPLAPSPYSPPIENLRHRLIHPLQVLIETALLDRQSRQLGLPFSSLFGGAWRDRVSTDYWMGRVTPKQAARCALRAIDLGFRGLKLKTTLEDPNVERLEAIKSAGGGFCVTVDPNGRFYRLDDAWPTLKAMDAVGVMSAIEDPFPRSSLNETRALRERVDARVVIHVDPPESLSQVIAANCCGGLNLDSHSQGLFQWRLQAATADQFNLPVWHGSGLDLGIYTAAQLHLAAATPNCQLSGDQAGPWLRASTLVKEKFAVVDGCVLVPSGPGLGVTPSTSEIEHYASESDSVTV